MKVKNIRTMEGIMEVNLHTGKDEFFKNHEVAKKLYRWIIQTY
ncbi:hypothetical protein QIO_4005 [Clostridioides difficile DA00129]|nr:hypothetical protein QIO_4005 [Clostridioides difficile DA00129]